MRPISDERSLALIRTRAAAMRAAVIPDWLTELMRPKPAPLPWPDMIRAALAICVPLAVGFAAGRPSIGLLPAAGGLLGTLTDRGGSYLYRVERVSSVGVFGGAVGLAIGSAIHGRGWIAVIALVVVAGASAVLLVLFHGAWLLVPFGVLAALLPYGRNRNYGLLATFLTPLVVVLVDLLKPVGWRLAGDRLVDTLIGCAIVLVVGFAPWPMSWYAHLPGKFGQAALDVCEYMNEALGAAAPASGAAVTSAAAGSRRRRSTYRALGDLRAEFQRTMSEPPSVSRSAAAWWPRDGRPGTGPGRGYLGLGRREPRRQRAARRGSAVVRGAACGQRGGLAGDAAAVPP
jgi:uncharacterized membrane protein YccC